MTVFAGAMMGAGKGIMKQLEDAPEEGEDRVSEEDLDIPEETDHLTAADPGPASIF